MWFCGAACVAGDAHLWTDLSQTVMSSGDAVKVITVSRLFKCTQVSCKIMSRKNKFERRFRSEEIFPRPKT